MAGGKSKYLEKKLLDHVCGGPDYSRPVTVYVALSTALYDETLDGSTIVEPVGNSYARVSVTNNDTNWPAATTPTAGQPAVKANGTTITFPTPSGAWGIIKSVSVFDGSGNLLWGGDLVTPKTIGSGDVTAFTAGTLVWKED